LSFVIIFLLRFTEIFFHLGHYFLHSRYILLRLVSSLFFPFSFLFFLSLLLYFSVIYLSFCFLCVFLSSIHPFLISALLTLSLFCYLFFCILLFLSFLLNSFRRCFIFSVCNISFFTPPCHFSSVYTLIPVLAVVFPPYITSLKCINDASLPPVTLCVQNLSTLNIRLPQKSDIAANRKSRQMLLWHGSASVPEVIAVHCLSEISRAAQRFISRTARKCLASFLPIFEGGGEVTSLSVSRPYSVKW
jgi:hypothetical protein